MSRSTNLPEEMMTARYFQFLLIFICLFALTAPFAVLPAEAAVEKPATIASAQGGAEKNTHQSAEKQDPQEELGKMLSFWSIIPFVIILLVIALVPLFYGHWWESNVNKGIMSILCSIPILAYLFWIGPLGEEVLADVLKDYYAFIILLVALFTISGGIFLEGNLKATPLVNTVLIGIVIDRAKIFSGAGESVLTRLQPPHRM